MRRLRPVQAIARAAATRRQRSDAGILLGSLAASILRDREQGIGTDRERGTAAYRALYAIEANIRGQSAEARRTVRQAESKPRVEPLRTWLEAELARVSAKSVIASVATDRCQARQP